MTSLQQVLAQLDNRTLDLTGDALKQELFNLLELK